MQTKLLSVTFAALLASCALTPSAPLSGNAVLRCPAGDSEIVITTTDRVAGAIHSLTWGGKEFIDSVDHGRQLQSASNLDAGVQPIRPETFNPTEAGSRRDHVGPTSSSRLLSFTAKPLTLDTTTQMAFWLAPGDRSGANPARNTTVLSNHVLEKHVWLGWRGMPHVIEYNVAFTVPANERHSQAVFEALTGYMPAEFSRFWKVDPASGALEPLTDGPGEQAQPVVLATESGSHAMGVWSPEPNARYGRFRFAREKVVKWNCVFRHGGAGQTIAPGRYAFRQFVIVGTLADVRDALRHLPREFAAAQAEAKH